MCPVYEQTRIQLAKIAGLAAVCLTAYDDGKQLSPGFFNQLRKELNRLERISGRDNGKVNSARQRPHT